MHLRHGITVREADIEKHLDDIPDFYYTTDEWGPTSDSEQDSDVQFGADESDT